MTARRTSGKADDDGWYHSRHVMQNSDLLLPAFLVIAAVMPAWKLTHESFTKLHPGGLETLVQANKYMEQFEKEYHLPNQTAGDIRPLRSKIKIAMNEIKESSEKEIG